MDLHAGLPVKKTRHLGEKSEGLSRKKEGREKKKKKK